MEKNIYPFEKNIPLCEFIGIMLGDGNLRESLTNKARPPFKSMQYIVRITLGNKNKEYVKHTKELFTMLFGICLNEYRQKNCVQLSCYSKKLVIALKQFGLIPNNKVKNQVGVPEWIFEKEDWIKFCFVGLVDTDGSLYQTQDGYWVINFSNMSKQLLNDFRRMCDKLNVHSTKTKHCIQICRQADVNYLLREFPFYRIKRQPPSVAGQSYLTDFSRSLDCQEEIRRPQFESEGGYPRMV